MTAKSRKVPSHVRCFYCGCDRALSKYSGRAPLDCDSSLFQHTQDMSMPFHSIACPCGHYTSYGHLDIRDKSVGFKKTEDETGKDQNLE